VPIVQGRSENRHVSLTNDSSNPLRPTTRTDVPAGIAPSAAHKDQFGVEPICRVLEIAPSTYYAAASRPTLCTAADRRGAETGAAHRG
jgi:hypothetical protein